MDLGLGPELDACVQCGLCLPHCPTFRVTGDEARSPRGRIALMRALQWDDAPLTEETTRSFETCVQCRGCETACPSGVHFGALMEQTRETLAAEHEMSPAWQRAALAPLSHPRVLRAGTAVAAAAQQVAPIREALKKRGLPGRLPTHQPAHRSSGDDVILFTGCVMDAWQRDVHDAAQRVVESAGFGVTPSGDLAPCCGALHLHAGLVDRTRHLARQIIGQLPPDRPVVVDSAGCGAALKDYGRLLDTAEAHAFSARVYDISEWLAPHLDRLPPPAAGRPLPIRVAVQDPCHLRHVQRAHQHTRTVLRPYVAELVELDDEGLCCGAGGSFSLLEPELAGAIRQRKLAAIDRAAADLVASANPGCSMHLAAQGARTVHPISLVWASIEGRMPTSAGGGSGSA